jgi:hypothetical protein
VNRHAIDGAVVDESSFKLRTDPATAPPAAPPIRGRVPSGV